MKYILIFLAYEFVRPKIIWLWYYLVKKGSDELNTTNTSILNLHYCKKETAINKM